MLQNHKDSEMSDEDLAASSFSGNEEYFKIILARYSRYVFNFIRQFVGPEDAEDATQETFLKAWKNLGKFDQSKRFKAWLFQIARNTAIDYLRKKKAFSFSQIEEAEGEHLDIPDEGPGPEEIFVRVETAGMIQRFLEEMPIIYRSLLVLYYQDGLTLREIAQIQGESVDTVKSRHRRGLAILKKKLLNATGT
jgi:RNA polymerase sigma-70 factor (ECF subfamily)